VTKQRRLEHRPRLSEAATDAQRREELRAARQSQETREAQDHERLRRASQVATAHPETQMTSR